MVRGGAACSGWRCRREQRRDAERTTPAFEKYIESWKNTSKKVISVIKSMAFSYKETFAGVIRLKGQHMVGLHYTICGKIKHCNTSTSPHVRVYKEVN